jgi:signal peptidase complex subunit 2
MVRSKNTQNDAREPRSTTPNRSDPISSPTSSPERPAGPLSITIAPEDREAIKVNNANSTDLKHACDDALKRVLRFTSPV